LLSILEIEFSIQEKLKLRLFGGTLDTVQSMARFQSANFHKFRAIAGVESVERSSREKTALAY